MTTPGIIFSFLFCAYLYVMFMQSRSDRRQKLYEEEKKANEKALEIQAKQDDQLFISSVSDLLPDSDAALSQLLTRYCWDQIIGTIGLSSLHINILWIASHDKQVRLPNMQADRYEAGERFVAREVRRTTSWLDDVRFYGVDSFAQEPTVEMLRELVSSGYITTAEPITKNSRDFECEITPNGTALLALDSHYCKNKTHLRRVLSEEERKVIRAVLYHGIHSMD